MLHPLRIERNTKPSELRIKVDYPALQKDFRRVNLAVNKVLNATPELEKRSTRRTFG